MMVVFLDRHVIMYVTTLSMRYILLQKYTYCVVIFDTI